MRGEAGEGRRLKQLNSSRPQEGAPCRSGSIFESAEYVHFRAVAHSHEPSPKMRSQNTWITWATSTTNAATTGLRMPLVEPGKACVDIDPGGIPAIIGPMYAVNVKIEVVALFIHPEAAYPWHSMHVDH